MDYLWRPTVFPKTREMFLLGSKQFGEDVPPWTTIVLR